MAYTIYLRTNLVNGKQYVGQTKDWEARHRQWKCLKTNYANKFLDEDREKYGLKNWKSEVLATVETREEAWELEKRFINDFNTKYPNGYNMSDGGKTAKGCIITEDGIKTRSENTGKKNPMFGKHHSEETKKKMSETRKGRHFSEETEFEGKPIVQLKGNILIAIWPTEKEAAKNVEGCHTSSIAQCCKGKRKSAGGYGWMYKEDYDKMQ